MKLALNWLRNYCEWEWSVEEFAEQLTMSGTEVEAITYTGFSMDQVVVARVISYVQHPNADRLRLCQVDDGSGTARQIVCGAKNFQEGDKVALAVPGAQFPPSEKSPEGFKIKKSKLRGEVSEGMMCSGDELGIPDDADGIMILPTDTPVGVPLKEIFTGDTVVEVEVTPNRPDLLSYRGVARELCALGAKAREVSVEGVSGAEEGGAAWAIHVSDEKGCLRYTGIEIQGVQVGASPKWLKERLESIGVRSINNVVDVTNYVLFETGQPLHAFDADQLEGETIFVRRAEAGETFQALDEKTYELKRDDLVIADQNKAVALAGVMGGSESGVSEGTQRIFLESALFEADGVRQTSRRLGLISDSSYRFERGVDPSGVDAGRKRAIELILEVAGGTVVGQAVESAGFQYKAPVISLRSDRVRKVLGMEVSDERIESILLSLGLEHGGGANWLVPSYRGDLEREVDLIEEVARLVDYREVPSRLPRGVAYRSNGDEVYDLENRLRQCLATLGYHEVVTSSLICSLEKRDRDLRLLNPLNEDLTEMRRELLDSVLPVVKHNLAMGNRSGKFYEIGKVYSCENGKVGEEKRLLILGYGNEVEASWNEAERGFDYYDLKGTLERVQEEVPGFSFQVEGYGLVAVEKLKAHGVKTSVYAVEAVLKHQDVKDRVYEPVSNQPAVHRDLAFTVANTVKAGDVAAAIDKISIECLEEVHCFDVYQDESGEKLAKDKKSLAFRFCYRAKDRTLKDKEVSKWERKIVDSVKQATGGVLREDG